MLNTFVHHFTQIERLEVSAAAKDTENTRLVQDLQRAAQFQSELQAELADAQKRSLSLTDEASKMREQLSKLDEDMSDATSTIQQLKIDLQALKSENVTLRDEVTSLRARLEKETAAKESADGDRRGLATEL